MPQDSNFNAPDQALQKARQTLNAAIFWFLGCGAIAAYAGFKVQPAASYTAGAAMIGVVWAILLIAFWRTRATWSIAATMFLVLGLTVLRDHTFPGPGFLRGIYGGAVALAAGMLFLWLFRRSISRFCRLDHNDPRAFLPPNPAPTPHAPGTEHPLSGPPEEER